MESRYLLGREIGRGATGVVYAALDVRNGSSVAIKRSSLVRCSVEAIASLKREISVLSRLSSPHVVRYIGSYSTEDTINLVTELVEGGSVAGLVARHGPLPETLASFLVAQALCGLDYLHAEGLLHRDVKAANLLVNKHGVLKLADLGLVLDIKAAAELPSARREPSSGRSDTANARTALPPTTARSSVSDGGVSARGVAGSAHWWSPEVIDLGVPTAAADVWALGATVIELVTGSPPYSEYGAIAACFRICSDVSGPPMPPSASPKLCDFLAACFTRDPIRRPTARALLNSTWIASSLDALEGDPSRTTHRLLKEVQLRRADSADETPGTVAGGDSPAGSSASLSGSNGLPDTSHSLKRTTSLQAVAEATAASTLRLVRPSANSFSASSPIHVAIEAPPSTSEVRSLSASPDGGASITSSALSPSLRIPWSPGGASLTSAATLLALSSPAATRGGSSSGALSDDEHGTQVAGFARVASTASLTESQDVARHDSHIRSLVSELTPARYAARGGSAVRSALVKLLARLLPEHDFEEDEVMCDASVVRVARGVLEECSSLSTIAQLVPAFPSDVAVRVSAVRLMHTIARGSTPALETLCDLGVPSLIFALILLPSGSPDELRVEAATFAATFARTRALLRAFLAAGGLRVTIAAMTDANVRVQQLGVSCGMVLSDSSSVRPNLRAELIAAGALCSTTNCLTRSLRAVVAGLSAEDLAATTPLTASSSSLHRATSLTSWALSSSTSSVSNTSNTSNTSQTLSSTAERASASTSPNGSEASTSTPEFRALPLSPPLPSSGELCAPLTRGRLPQVSAAVEDAIKLISQCAVFIAALAADVGVRALLAEQPLLSALLRVFRPSPLALLTHGTYARAVSRATRALKYVSLHETNATALAACDAVPILVGFFARSVLGSAEQDEGMTVTLLAALFNLLRFSRARSAAAAAAGIVEPLLQLASAQASPISTRALSVQLLCDLSRSADVAATRESLFSAHAPALLARLIGSAHAPLSAHCLGIIASLAAADAAQTAAALLATDGRGLRAIDVVMAACTTGATLSESEKIVADLAAPLAALVASAPSSLNAAIASAPLFLAKITACVEASAAALSDALAGARAALLLRQLLGILAAVVKELPPRAAGEDRVDDDAAAVASAVRGIAARVEGRVVLENAAAEVLAAVARLLDIT
jgi:serine/threonine protein kinase